MTRTEFIKMCGVLGIGIPLQHAITSCEFSGNSKSKFSGKVLIIGAGAGGLSAGYLLHQQGVDFEIIEASSIHGGRLKTVKDFADFPIPMGAEWIETNTGVFEDIVNDKSVTIDIQTIPDNPDRKFVNYSWLNFFDDYIVPKISNKITYNTEVTAVDYTQNKIIVKTTAGEFTSDKVIISVPLKILQLGIIQFTPAFPQGKMDTIQSLEVWDGFKAFFEFKTNFYGNDEYNFPLNSEKDGQKIIYNAALGQNSNRHILGLFVVGKPVLDYTLRSGNELRDFILGELDAVYGNKATVNYVKHITQNWGNEPFIKAGYLSDYAEWRTVKKLSENVVGKVFFAGSEYTDGEDWVSVHTAAQSAKIAISELMAS